MRQEEPMICSIVGARPNFVKMAPIMHELKRRGLRNRLVHTGQHYDRKMSDVFFEELEMPKPDIHLGVGSGTHAGQTAQVMTSFEPVLQQLKPAIVLVAGDVNSTLACALTAAKLHVPVGHVEAGLRSFDRLMPEEINRVLTDHLSDLLMVTEPSGRENLLKEGIGPEKIHFVGNTMIDSLEKALPAALKRAPWATYGFEKSGYGMATLHRPANVDDPVVFKRLLGALEAIAERVPILLPAHPRTVERMKSLEMVPAGVRVIAPLGYLDFLGMMAGARLVLTDSGGIQEETTALGVPCLTLRENTERPVTITRGTNRLAGISGAGVLEAVESVLKTPPSGERPELWDGRAAVRVVDVIQGWLES